MPRSNRSGRNDQGDRVVSGLDSKDVIDLTQDSPSNIALRRSRAVLTDDIISLEENLDKDSDVLVDETVEISTNRKRSGPPVTITLEDTINLDDSKGSKQARTSSEDLDHKQSIFCPICLENFSSQNIKAMTTPCGHVFCSSCLKTISEQKKKCSICQRPIKFKKCIRLHI